MVIAGARVSHLSLDSDRVKAALGQVGAVGMAQVVERELRDAGRIETRGFGRFVEPAGRDVAVVHRTAG